MNKKITTYFLRMIRNKWENKRLYYTYDEDNYYICDGYFLRAVPKDKMELNINLFQNKKQGLDSVLEETKDTGYKEGKIKYYVPDKNNKGIFHIRIENEETHAYISSEYLKLFDDATKFKIISSIKAVICFKEEKGQDVFLGLILPIRMDREV